MDPLAILLGIFVGIDIGIFMFISMSIGIVMFIGVVIFVGAVMFFVMLPFSVKAVPQKESIDNIDRSVNPANMVLLICILPAFLR